MTAATDACRAAPGEVSELLADALAASTVVPLEWRATQDQLTPSGHTALFRSNMHASIAIRLLYLEAVAGTPGYSLQERLDCYASALNMYVAHGHRMTEVVRYLPDGPEQVAAIWNEIPQAAVDRAFRVMLGEREPLMGVNLASHAWRHFGLVVPAPTARAECRDRPVRPSDNNAAWERAADGSCRGCGTPTVRHADRNALHKMFRREPGVFCLHPTYRQHSGRRAPLWPQVTMAAKGVAEHVVPRSQGGRTSPDNLTNACTACNFSRNDSSMDVAGVAAYN